MSEVLKLPAPIASQIGDKISIKTDAVDAATKKKKAFRIIRRPMMDDSSDDDDGAEQESKTADSTASSKPVRIYCDGCWDVMHSGHYNAIRQAKALGDVLVAGVHSDKEIAQFKRNPVMNNEQRMAAVSACKWVDEVVFDTPYQPTSELLTKLNCDFVAHGDDMPKAADGSSYYAPLGDKVKIFRRTPGVSTTHLIQRLVDAVAQSEDPKSDEQTSVWSSFLASSSRISAFSNDRVPTTEDRVVLICGAFDLFHIGHIDALKKAKALGTFLYVGLYDDATVRQRKGRCFPVMGLQERVLNVLSCKFVDDVVIGCPWAITKGALKALHISMVVTSNNTDIAPKDSARYAVPKAMGIFRELKNDIDYTTQMLMDKIATEQKTLEAQNKSRVEKAKRYAEENTYTAEQTTKHK